MAEWWTQIASAVAGSAATWGALVLTGKRNRQDNALGLITALQKRVDQLEERIAEAETSARVMENYAAELREQIYRGDGPPPKEWPTT